MNRAINTKSNHRSAFTLLELLAVITIISILLALILPAIGGAMRRAKIAEVSTEISQLDQALQMFKQRFGEYPPSNLIIPATGDPWAPADRAKVRAIWPEFNFTLNGGLGNSTAFHLSGAECLVFFLGGVGNGDVTSPVLAGFAKNPQAPWAVGSTNVDGPFMEFDMSRISDVDNDRVFEYRDSLSDGGAPYLFISAAGKSLNKDNDAAPDDYDVYGDRDTGGFGNGQQDMSFCYFELNGTKPLRKDSFQIISPGEDGLYGTGGPTGDGIDLRDRDIDGNSTIENSDANSNGTFEPIDNIELRGAEADNITNFSGGTLG